MRHNDPDVETKRCLDHWVLLIQDAIRHRSAFADFRATPTLRSYDGQVTLIAHLASGERAAP